MRFIRARKEPPASFSASAALLAEGARFNDEVHRLPNGNASFVPKGARYFHAHEGGNRKRENSLVHGMDKTVMATAQDKNVSDRIILERAFEVYRQEIPVL